MRRFLLLSSLVLLTVAVSFWHLGLSPAAAQPTVIATIPVGTGPWSVATNPATNRIYVLDFDNDVSVIDGATNTVVATIPIGDYANDLAVNPTTNRIYVTKYGNEVSVIDGATNTVTATIPVGVEPRGVAVIPTTNRIYVANYGTDDVSVINGDTNTVVATVSGLSYASNVATNPATNRIYVTHPIGPSTVWVIDGATNTVVDTIDISEPTGVATNPATNRIYVGDTSNNLSVVDGATNTVTATIPLGEGPAGVAVNPTTNRIYVADYIANEVSVIDGDTNTVTATIGVGTGPAGVAVNSTTNRIYVTNSADDTVTVIEHNGAAPPAVLLVHGWRGSCSTFSTLEPWVEEHLGVPEERVECFDPDDGRSEGYVHEDGTIENAQRLKTYAEDFLGRMAPVRDGKIDIVAHSFGGLVSRYYIEELGGSAEVRSLTMLGTPNRGTRAANVAVMDDMSRCLVNPISPGCIADRLDGGLLDDWAAYDMRTASNEPGGLLYDLNEGFVVPSGTYYGAVAGTHSTWAYRWLGDPNDCLVPVESVEGPFPEVSTSRPVSHPAACILAPAYLTNDPSDDCSSDADHVFCDVLAMLEAATPGSAAYVEAGTASTDAAVSSGATPAGTGFIPGHVEPETSNSHPVVIDASVTSVAFSLFWDGAGDALHLTLERPDGTPVDPSDPDVTYSPPGEMAAGFFAESYEVSSPAADEWTMYVEAVSVPPDGHDYTVSGFFDTVVTLTFGPEPASVSVREPVTLTATLEESGTPLTDATVDVTVAKPDDSSTLVALADDGVAPDEHAADGTYTGTLTDTATCGVYTLDVQAQGTASTGPFSRGDSSFVDAHVPGHLTGDPCTADTAVGGIAELPELAVADFEAFGSSGSRAGLFAVVAAAVTAFVALAGGGVWYTRRRLLR